MDQHRTSAGPIAAAILMLLVAIYVGSYFALVVPRGEGHDAYFSFYRIPNVDPLYWPLEQADRKIRPTAWLFLHEDGDLGPYLAAPRKLSDVSEVSE